MDFTTAIKTCLKLRYFDFQGRARRSEYWWFFLFNFLVSLVLGWIPIIGLLITLGLLIPGIAVTVRRLHDTGRTGWWLLAPLGIAIVGALITWPIIASGQEPSILLGIIGLAYLGVSIMLLVWFCQRGTVGPNAWGPDPYDPAGDVEAVFS
ncbi:DUF805 domain-containing protein [Gymnodinialimonas sp. 2305UL16-5]|uniref:DUF805 domain-containing protein n=1 Tax=Gymnodinialimonas mytili TaxID=3126503 RepID=UPI0030A09FAE